MLGIGAVALWGEQGLLAFVLAGPFASFVIGHVIVARLPRINAPHTPLTQLAAQWRTFARLGAAFMVAGLVTTLSHLAVRALVQRELGAEALGHFQAAWMISVTYIGFVLAAMGTDFYPRLTAAVQDHTATNRLVNEQTEVALLLAGPVFLAMLGFSPWVIELLYSSQFGDSITVLRWQILGDVLKVASWPLGFIILAAGDGRAFMWTEFFAMTVFTGLTWVGLPILGIQAIGIAFLGTYAAFLPTVYWLAKRRTCFVWEPRIFKHLMLLVLAAIAVFGASLWSEWASARLGLTAALGFGVHGIVHLKEMTNLDGSLGRASGVFRKLMFRMGIRND